MADRKEPFHLATARLVKRFKEVRHYLVRDSITEKEGPSRYRVTEVANAALEIAEHLADGP